MAHMANHKSKRILDLNFPSLKSIYIELPTQRALLPKYNMHMTISSFTYHKNHYSVYKINLSNFELNFAYLPSSLTNAYDKGYL